MDTGLDAALSDSLDGMEYLYLIDGDLCLRRQTIHLKLHPHMMEYYNRLMCFHSSFFLIGYKPTACVWCVCIS